MMFRKIFFAAILLSVLSTAACAKFCPRVSLLGNYTATKNYSNVSSGAFDIQNRNFNFGLELMHKFYLANDLFLRTGFRYNTYKTAFYGRNQMPEISIRPHPLTWKRGYESYAIPIQLGRDFAVNNSNRGEFYIGAAAGILKHTSYEESMSFGGSGNPSVTDTVRVTSVDSIKARSSFFPAIDFGFNYQPFKSKPRFSVGILCSIQLNKTEPYTYNAIVQHINTGKVYRYEIEHHQSVVNCAVSLNYTFGKPRSIAKKNDQLDCHP